jgi:hypothetical protein
VADVLTDQAWADFCAAAKRTPDAEARAVLSALLYEEYPAFHYDRKRVAAILRQSEQMLKHLDAFAELYQQAWRPHLPGDQFKAILEGRADAFFADDKDTERDLWSIATLRRRRPEALWLAARAIRRANKGRKNVQHEWLYHRLCGIWLDHFRANDLTYTVPPLGGPPQGELIAFVLAVAREVMPKLPSAETVRDAIDRERIERENAKQLYLHFVERRRAMGF